MNLALRAEESSLGRRLSVWLALQVFLGLTLVSVAVYIIIANHLATRQERLLEEKQDLVMHLVEEAGVKMDMPYLTHQLDDFLAGQHNLVLSLVHATGEVFYDTTNTVLNLNQFRKVAFPVDALNNSSEPTQATLFYSSEDDDSLLTQLAITLALVSLLVAILVSIGVFWIVRRGLRPVNDLSKQIITLTADTLDSRLDGSMQPTELQPLITQFNLLLERLSLSYRQLEGFNADVAHELNTPLTTMITSCELTLRKPHDVQSLKETMGSNLEELHRMSGIINDMLFLSRAHRGARARRKPVASLASIAAEVADYHEAFLLDADLELAIEGDTTGEFDVQLIKRAISNLLGNATRYATPQSTVHIFIQNQNSNKMSISIKNQGELIEESHKHRLFDRFYRADSSRAHADSHHGLGLSIVAGIARMHGGEPFVESDTKGTCIGFSAMRNGH